VNLKLAALATAFLLISGCSALNGETTPQGPADDRSPVAIDTSRGASSAATQQASSAARPQGRTRAEVHAEAVEAVKHYKSTSQEERDYFLPWSH
jgi:cAMP phosphodiesterase